MCPPAFPVPAGGRRFGGVSTGRSSRMVDVCWHGGVATVAVRGEIDSSTAPRLSERLAEVIGGAQPRRLILDLADVPFVDCAGARALAGVRAALPGCCQVVIRSLCPSARKVFALTGLWCGCVVDGVVRTGVEPSSLPARLPGRGDAAAGPGQMGWNDRGGTGRMRDVPALIATVDQVAGVATVTVHGELEPFTFSRLRDRLRWVAQNCPDRLVVDLGVADRFTDQVITLITVARAQLPPGCPLEVRSASPVVRGILQAAGWPGVQVSASPLVGRRGRPAGVKGGRPDG